MNTLLRSSTTTLSRRSSAEGYEPLDRRPRLSEASNQHVRSSRSSSKRKKLDHSNVKSRSYRAKQRRIFLNSYELATPEKIQRRRRSESRRLKSLAAKAVNGVASVVKFLRIASVRLRSRDCRFTLNASSPSSKHKN